MLTWIHEQECRHEFKNHFYAIKDVDRLRDQMSKLVKIMFAMTLTSLWMNRFKIISHTF